MIDRVKVTRRVFGSCRYESVVHLSTYAYLGRNGIGRDVMDKGGLVITFCSWKMEKGVLLYVTMADGEKVTCEDCLSVLKYIKEEIVV